MPIDFVRELRTRAAASAEGVTYRLNNLYPTVQCEGVMTGVPMMLVRLHGCPVACSFCDTKETWALGEAARADQVGSFAEARGATTAWVEVTARELVRLINIERGGREIGWVMLTGGEPALQPLRPLVRVLHSFGYKVALETSGTALGHLAGGDAAGDDCDWVCVSPKIANPGGLPILTDALRSADEVKHVIGKAAHLAALDDLLTVHGPLKPDVVVCLQPMSQSPKATEFCLDACLRRGWRVSIQIHKYLGVE